MALETQQDMRALLLETWARVDCFSKLLSEVASILAELERPRRLLVAAVDRQTKHLTTADLRDRSRWSELSSDARERVLEDLHSFRELVEGVGRIAEARKKPSSS